MNKLNCDIQNLAYRLKICDETEISEIKRQIHHLKSSKKLSKKMILEQSVDNVIVNIKCCYKYEYKYEYTHMYLYICSFNFGVSICIYPKLNGIYVHVYIHIYT